MISKELLGLVLDEETIDVRINNENLEYKYTRAFSPNKVVVINLDTLTRKMKEWCLKQDYWIMTLGNTDTEDWYYSVGDNKGNETSKDRIPTEFEAVLKATQWVANEKGLL